MLHFVLAKELRGNRIIVEIWDEHKLVGCIYPHEDCINVVSKFLKDVQFDKTFFPPSVVISFKR